MWVRVMKIKQDAHAHHQSKCRLEDSDAEASRER